jgi:hypothetical protein
LTFTQHRAGLTSEAECLYHLLSAKFMAESNKFVGGRTFATVHAFNHPSRHLHEAQIAEIRAAWERSAIPKLPKAIIKRIPKMLGEHEAAIDWLGLEVLKKAALLDKEGLRKKKKSQL